MRRTDVYRDALGEESPVSPWSRAWGVSVVVHALALAVPMMWPTSRSAVPPPPAALAVEIAELAVAPAPIPAPVEEEPPAPAPKPAPPVRPEPKPQPKPEPKRSDALAIETVPQEPARPDPPVAEAPVQPTPSQTAPAEATVAAAPVRGAQGVAQPDAVQTWESLVMAEIERHKRYPASARWARQEDIVSVRVVVHADGSIGATRIVASQGFDALDNEVLQTLRRAGRLPPPPGDALANGVVTLTIPIQFVLKGR